MTATIGRERAEPLRLAITAIEREEDGDSAGKPFSNAITYYREVTVAGDIHGFKTHGLMGNMEFGNGHPLPESVLHRLDALQSDLPDDGSRLPPASRRVLLQSAQGGRTTVRVYDRGNLPDAALEILRLTRCEFGVYVPEFQPQGEIASRGYEPDGFLCLSPDGKQILSAGRHRTLQFWEPATHALLREVPILEGESIAFSPDGRQALVSGRSASDLFDTRTWESTRINARCYSSQFTADGRHVLLQFTKSPLQILDANTWRPVDHLDEVPPDTVRYFPARKRARAVRQSMTGIVALWDTARHREVTRLGEDAKLYGTAFSPDESLVAVVLESQDGNRPLPSGRIEIRRADTGELKWKLLPWEKPGADGYDLQCLLWSPDGQYLFAGSQVFSLESGRHRAQLGGSSRVNGLALLPDGSQLFVGDQEGKIRYWDFPDTIKKIKEFEQSLEPPTARHSP